MSTSRPPLRLWAQSSVNRDDDEFRFHVERELRAVTPSPPPDMKSFEDLFSARLDHARFAMRRASVLERVLLRLQPSGLVSVTACTVQQARQIVFV